jgi:ribulose-5-phosphate 4-epimerase/fuculose-1-phosphate aldolase
MIYDDEIGRLLRAVEILVERGVLDGMGGALSLRAKDGNIVMNVTGSAQRAWQIGDADVTVFSPDGKVVRAGSGPAAAGAVLHLALYQAFPICNSIVHAHSPHVLAYACHGVDLPSVANVTDKLGRMPCFFADDEAIKRMIAGGTYPKRINTPDCAPQRPDVTAINLELAEQVARAFGPRANELDQHGLGFLVNRHGHYAFANTLEAAVDTAHRMETSARAGLYVAALRATGEGGPRRATSALAVAG